MEAAQEHIEQIAKQHGRFDLEGVNIVGTGADATYKSLLSHYAQPLLNAETPSELAAACVRVQNALNYLAVYNTRIAATGPPLLTHINLDAAKRFTLATGTNVGNQEGYGYIKGTTRNYFGFGETINADLHMGTRTTKSNLLTLSLPAALVGMPIEWKAELLGYDSNKHADWGLHKEEVRGGTLRFSSLLHSFGIDAVLRTMYSENHATLASRTFCTQAGHAFKLSIFSNFTHDTRDNMFLPTRGSLCRLASELSAGDHPSAKVTADLQQAVPLSDKFSATLTTRLGYLQPLAGTTTHLMDRFYMGGSTDVRGFTMNGAGPHEGRISVGGNYLAAGGLSVFGPIPRASENLRAHVFGNAGALGDTVSEMLKPRVSAGFGLVYNHPVSRFELSIAMPLVAHTSDRCSKGLQLGIGMQYL